MMTASSNPQIEQTDIGMGRYYKRLGRDDYFNDDENGKFKVFCQDNEYDDDLVQDELETFEDCTLIDFDKHFPLKKGADHQNKEKIIFNVIKTCWTNSDAYSVNHIDIEPEDFIIDEKAVEELSNKFKNCCPTLFEEGFDNDDDNDNDGILMKMLYIGQKIGHVPYLQFCADLYARDKLRHYLAIKKRGESVDIDKLKPSEWVLINKHTLQIQKFSKNKKEFEMVKSSIDTFYKRICPLMNCYARIKIIDSYQDICESISAALDFVSNLAHNQQTDFSGNATCPFQYDFGIAFNDVRRNANVKNNDNKDDDDEDDDDDNDDKIEDEDKDNRGFYDCFMNIKERCKAKNLIFVTEADQKNKQNEAKPNTIKRFQNQYEEFRNILKSKHNDKEFNQHPHRFRFISILDRRSPAKTGNKGKGIRKDEELIFIEPTSDCHKFPKDKQCDNLWCFNSSKTCIIPNKCNDDGDDDDNKHDDIIKDTQIKPKLTFREKLQTQTINTKHTMNNALLLLSFHAHSKDEIRCYMYLGGFMIRFLPDDLKNYLPQFFVQSQDNIAYKNGKGIEILIQNMKEKLIDSKFKTFEKNYRTDDISIKQDIDNKLENYD